MRDLEEQYDRYRRDQPAELTPDDRDMIMTLCSDIPALWQAATTPASDRRVVVRHLIERVEVAVQGETEWVDVVVHWSGASPAAMRSEGPSVGSNSCEITRH